MVMMSESQLTSLLSLTSLLAKQLNAEDKLQEIRYHYVIIYLYIMSLSSPFRALNDRIAYLEANEKKLLADIKKRGDIARQMIQEKDNEIKRLSNSNVSSINTDNKTITNVTTNSNNNNINTETNNDISKIPYNSTTNVNINTEQSFTYLRQAFSGFVKAKRDAELENLGKYIF